MIWSWYLSVEIYLFIIAILLLMLARTHPHFAITIFTSFFISSFFTTAIIRIDNASVVRLVLNFEIDFTSSARHLLLSSNTTMSVNALAELNILYDQPWIRISPYIVGITFGCFLCKNMRKARIGIFTATAGKLFLPPHSENLLFAVKQVEFSL